MNDGTNEQTQGVTLNPAAVPLRGSVHVPSDKSINHRALILGSLVAPPGLVVTGLSEAKDVRTTAACLRALGVFLRESAHNEWCINASPPACVPSHATLDCGNSGTTLRLLMGLLAGREHLICTLTGDASLRRRPMRRVAEPLRHMGAQVTLHDDEMAPVHVQGRRPLAALREYTVPVPSAQVKSALILAALAADGPSRILDPFGTRDHTERMLSWLEPAKPAVRVERHDGGSEIIQVEPRPQGVHVAASMPLVVPGDPSAATFWLVAALLVPGSELALPRIGSNPRRTGALEVLRRMGAEITLGERAEHGGEPCADWHGRYTPSLQAVEVSPVEVPTLVDEIPVLAVAAAAADGTSRFAGLAELRHKESDRLLGTVALLRGLGVHAELEPPDTLLVHGRATPFSGNVPTDPLRTHGDHRLAMAAAVAALAAEAPVHVDSLASTSISDPTFLKTRERFVLPHDS